MIGTCFSFSFYVLVCSVFVTSISEFSSSIYLSRAFYLNAGCLRAGLPYIGLGASPTLTILVSVVRLVSTSFSAITTTVAAWILHV